jgi:hypothetical protein
MADDSLPYTLAFDPENIVPLSPRDSADTLLTPWMKSMTMVSDMPRYDEIRKMRLSLIPTYWPLHWKEQPRFFSKGHSCPDF